MNVTPIEGYADPACDEAVGRVAALVRDGTLCVGAQLVVYREGHLVADVAIGQDGLGRGITLDTLFALYCTAKPLTTLGVAQLVASGALDLDAPVGQVLDGGCGEGLARVRVRDLLNHSAGLHHLTAQLAVFTPPRMRGALVMGEGPPPGWRVGVDAAYSEFGAWHVLGAVVESVTGRPARDVVHERVIRPLGLEDQLFVGFSDDEYEANLDRLGVNLDMHNRRRTPLLMERTRRVCTDGNLALGGYGTARGVAEFYRRLVDLLAGRPAPAVVPVEVLRTFVQAQREPVWDPVLRRRCAFGLGFMVGLPDHHFGTRCSPGAFGHSGFGGLSCGFADPAMDLAVGLVFNGHVDAETSLLYRRRAVVDALYRGLLA